MGLTHCLSEGHSAILQNIVHVSNTDIEKEVEEEVTVVGAEPRHDRSISMKGVL